MNFKTFASLFCLTTGFAMLAAMIGCLVIACLVPELLDVPHDAALRVAYGPAASWFALAVLFVFFSAVGLIVGICVAVFNAMALSLYFKLTEHRAIPLIALPNVLCAALVCLAAQDYQTAIALFGLTTVAGIGSFVGVQPSVVKDF